MQLFIKENIMERKGKWRAGIAILILGVLMLTGCGSSGGQHIEGLDKLGDIEAVTREADSGTRASFDDITGITSENDQLKVAGSTEDLLKEVEGSKSAIGYMTVEAVDDKVKTLTVEGKKVDDPDYPMTRQLYLVYNGELTDLEKEFISYATGKGQDIIKKHFETVGKAETFLSLKPSGTIKIGGSSSEAPAMEEVAEAYMKVNPNAEITVETTDSGTGINNTMEGKYDLGMSSRSPKSYEENILTFVPVAKDRIAVVVPSDNPMTDITLDQLKSIYTGKVTKWSDLNK